MKTRLAVLLLGFVLVPTLALASQGILLLAHNGTPEWNEQVKAIAAKVNAQKPAEAVFGTPTRASIAAAVERLAKRGATDVLAVPFFLTTALTPEHFTGHPVPARIAPAVAEAPVLEQITLSLAEQLGDHHGSILVLVGHSDEDAGSSWKVDLGPTARQLNRARHFSSILTVPQPAAGSAREQQQIKASLARQPARRIVVVTAMSASSAKLTALEGINYDMAKSSILADDRLVQWLAELR